ncbi:hypothetical protein QTO34_016962 [Cnephaeus nilssonii]|uniref:Uncharacterized protein n=1 Tax=Cnephaeus nilssonii TaxID=3371016 RepID=A0AA40I3B4_CNENI|nr:hypothetical protein QTO34_016962 [Eptesicus nilssonii]
MRLVPGLGQGHAPVVRVKLDPGSGHSSWPLPAPLQMKCDHCTQKECSKKTKTNDQENATVNVRSLAQENREKGEFHKLADAKIFLSDCLCDSCVTAEEGVQISQQNTKDVCFLNLNLCVGEIVQIMEQSDLASNYATVDTLFGDMKEKEVRLHECASSNGHLAHIFRHMAKELFNEDMGVLAEPLAVLARHMGVLTYHTLRNKHFQEVTLERDREALLRFEAAYSCRNIQKWS